jgi:O-methyltransferase
MNKELLTALIQCNKIHLWGAASSGHRAFYKILELGIPASKIDFIDKNHEVLKSVVGRPVRSPEILSEINFSTDIVLIASSMVTEIIESQPEHIRENLNYSHDLLFSRAVKYKFDEEFLSTINELTSLLLLDIDEAFTIWSSIKETKDLEGDIVELGVYKGGSIRLMAKAHEFETGINKRIIGFDTFEGIPLQTGNGDEKFLGFLSDVSFEDIIKTMPNCVSLVKGIFPESATQANIEKISLAHLDADTYKSTFDGLNFVWPKLAKQGRIILHDYNSQGCPGVKKATDEFLQDKNVIAIEIAESQILLIKN